MKHTKLWGDVFKGLTEQLPQHAITTWFEPIKPVALSDGELVLEVPNQFFYEWIESHYKERLMKAFKNTTKKKKRCYHNKCECYKRYFKKFRKKKIK